MLADFKDASGQWVRSFGGRAKQQRTLSGSVWTNMTQRCRPDGAYQQANPSYVGCKVSRLFSDFQTFTDWHVAQLGYGLEGYDLDKDMLGDGKTYSEDVCVLIPHRLNTFFRLSFGKEAKGVYRNKDGSLYSNITIERKARRLGTFKTYGEAEQAFKTARQAEVARWGQRLQAGEFKVDPRVVDRVVTLSEIKEV